MNLMERMGLLKESSAILKSLKSGDVPLMDRIKMLKSHRDILVRLKASVAPTKTKTLPKVGEGLTGVEIDRTDANQITITRQGAISPIVMDVMIDRKKSLVTIVNNLMGMSAAKKFDYSAKEDSYADTIRAVNDYLLKELETHTAAQEQLAQDAEQKSESKKEFNDARIEELLAMRERLVKALEAFEDIKKRDEKGAPPTSKQLQIMREAILDFGASSKAYMDFGGMFRAGEGVMPNRLASIDEELASLGALSEVEGSAAPTLAERFKIGEFSKAKRDEFRNYLVTLKDELSLDELKQGVNAWFEANQSILDTQVLEAA